MQRRARNDSDEDQKPAAVGANDGVANAPAAKRRRDSGDAELDWEVPMAFHQADTVTHDAAASLPQHSLDTLVQQQQLLLRQNRAAAAQAASLSHQQIHRLHAAASLASTNLPNTAARPSLLEQQLADLSCEGLFLNPLLQPQALSSISLTEQRLLLQQQQLLGRLPPATQLPSQSLLDSMGGLEALNPRPIAQAALSRGHQRLDPNTAARASFDILEPPTIEPGMSGKSPVFLYMSCDEDSLSEYQCLVRQQIQLFEASRIDVQSNAQGRNRAIVMGQVGIRCKHCAFLPPKHRARGATYYPTKLEGLYQAAQNLASGHLCEHCPHVPPQIRAQLLRLRERKSSAGGGKKYWGDGVRVLGAYEDEDGLRFGSQS